MKYRRVHMGEEIKKKWQENGMTLAQFSRMNGIHPNNSRKLFAKEEVGVHRLRMVSTVLDYDFIRLLLPIETEALIDPDEPTEEEVRLTAEVEQLQSSLATIREESGDVIAALEEQLGAMLEEKRELEKQVAVLEGKVEVLLMQR